MSDCYETKISLFGQMVDVTVRFLNNGNTELIEVFLDEKPLEVDGVHFMDDSGKMIKVEDYLCYQALQRWYQDDIAYEEKVAAIEHANDSREER